MGKFGVEQCERLWGRGGFISACATDLRIRPIKEIKEWVTDVTAGKDVDAAAGVLADIWGDFVLIFEKGITDLLWHG